MILETFNTIKEELIQYCHYCLEDIKISEYEDYISCYKHKLACKRLLNDFERENTEDFPYYWDEHEANQIVKWFSYLRHSKGELSGKPIILTIWQKFLLCQIYGWRRCSDGRKRFSKSFIECARKQAKSQMESGVALYELATQSTKNRELYEVYTAGTKRDQSKVIFDECKLMLNGSPLKTKFKLTRDKIIHIKTGSFIKPLCKEDGKKGDGTNPALLVLDEYHQHQTTEFYDLGLGANTKESLLMIITTAGMDLTYPCFTQEYKYCSSLLSGEIENDNYFVDIVELDSTDDIEDRRNWWKANPIRMSYQGGRDKLEEAYQIAKEIPEKMVAFKTKCLDIWVQATENGYMNIEKYNKCVVKNFDRSILRGHPCWVGFDMSAKIDLTSVCFVILIGNKYYILSHSFIPNYEALRMHETMDKQPFTAWWQQGFITVTNTPIVDQQQVIEYVENTINELGVELQGYWFDPANASKMMMDIQNSSPEIEIVEVYQSYKHLNECTQGFREQVYCENVVIEYNPVLNFAMANAVIRSNNGLIKIDKDSSTKRIDPVDSLLCGFKGAMYYDDTEPYDPISALDNCNW